MVASSVVSSAPTTGEVDRIVWQARGWGLAPADLLEQAREWREEGEPAIAGWYEQAARLLAG